MTRDALMVFAAFLAPAPSIAANWETGNSFYQKMSSQDMLDASFVLGYLEAISDEHSYDFSLHDEPFRQRICFPDGTTARQLADIVGKWLAMNPEKRTFDATFIVNAAFFEAFPCPPNPLKQTPKP